MDWQEKYLEQLERDIFDVKQHLYKMEENMDKKIDQLISSFEYMTKSRHDDYLAVNKRIDHLSQKLDQTITWTIRFTVGTFIGVGGLVVTILYSLR